MKIVFFLSTIIFSVSVFGQGLSKGNKAKNAGNEAFKKKDYVSAIKNWEKYFSSGEEGVATDLNTQNLYISGFKYAASGFLKNKNYQSAFSYYEKYFEKSGQKAERDSISIFNMAFSAKKISKNDVAFNMFQKSIGFNYKPDVCKLYLADIYRNMGDEAKMKEVLSDAMKQYPDSKYFGQMAAMLIKPFLREAAIPFNRANELAKEASTKKNADYISVMEQSCKKFQEAIPLFEKVLKYDPKNELARTYLKFSQDNIKSFNDYKAGLIKK
jgi:tetratricopeptide (TPR) repeat protein